jgi:hypothetical protein
LKFFPPVVFAPIPTGLLGFSLRLSALSALACRSRFRIRGLGFRVFPLSLFGQQIEVGVFSNPSLQEGKARRKKAEEQRIDGSAIVLCASWACLTTLLRLLFFFDDSPPLTVGSRAKLSGLASLLSKESQKGKDDTKMLQRNEGV